MQLLLLWVVGLGGAAVAVEQTSPRLVLLGAAAGASSWLVSQYVFHRVVLHPPPPQMPCWKRLHARVHGRHHEYPHDLAYVFLPLWGAPLLLAIGAIAGWVVGSVLISAFVYSLLLLLYEVMHFAAHVPYRPLTTYGRYMKRRHVLHHFHNECYWFGVTDPIADFVMRTWPSHEKVPRL